MENKLVSVTNGESGFKDVHVYPSDMTLEEAMKRKPDGEPSDYWVASYMALPSHCCC